jgi:hypothetical protein
LLALAIVREQGHSLIPLSNRQLGCPRGTLPGASPLKGLISRYPSRRPTIGATMATVLHSTTLLCIVIAHPKMVDTKDVTPPQAPVNISMKDLRLPSL